MTNFLRAVLPPPAVILLIAACMPAYAAFPDDTDARATRAHGVVSRPAPPRYVSNIGTARDEASGNLLLGGLAEVVEQGPVPIAAAALIPVIAIAARRRS